jgi:hypothetical protein
VFPEKEEGSAFGESKGWSAQATRVGKSASADLHIDLSIRNDTADWSTMQAAKKPALLISGKGEKTHCDTVFVGTGGHRLAPGFRMRGYIAGKKREPTVQLIYVECKGGEVGSGSKLTIEYSYVTGDYDYYNQGKNQVDDSMEISLDEVAQNLSYPIATPVNGLIQTSEAKFTALNQVVLNLKSAARVDQGLQFTWQTTNPSEYPSYVHIGNTPVIGQDGILYGYYETPDIVSVPITPGEGTTEWITQVGVPTEVQDFYIMLSVETGKQRLFTHYAVNVSDG